MLTVASRVLVLDFSVLVGAGIGSDRLNTPLDVPSTPHALPDDVPPKEPLISGNSASVRVWVASPPVLPAV